MPVTINEVAKEAGVSITTVSRVLNNNYPVKKETREKIEKAIEKLNYRPNIMARGLITKKTSVIGVIVPGITNLFFSTIVEEIEKTIKSFAYSIILCSTGGSAGEERSLVEDMICRQADGIIVIDPSIANIESDYYKGVSEKLPLVMVASLSEKTKDNCISYDEKTGVLDAFNYLKELKHREILFLRGEQSLSYDVREELYNKFINENHFSYKKVIEVGGGNSLEVVEETESKLYNVLKLEKPTAIFSCNDLMALGAMNTCKKLNIKVPEDISIISVDNTLIARTTCPRLTSVDFNMNLLAQKSAKTIMDMIKNDKNKTKLVLIETKLVVRESCVESRQEIKIKL